MDGQHVSLICTCNSNSEILAALIDRPGGSVGNLENLLTLRREFESR